MSKGNLKMILGQPEPPSGVVTPEALAFVRDKIPLDTDRKQLERVEIVDGCVVDTVRDDKAKGSSQVERLCINK